MINKLIVLMLAAMFLAGGTAYAQQGQDDLPGAGITPESSFFFLDRLGEAMRNFFTFGAENKVDLQLRFAAERIAEIREILDDRGVDAPGLEIARQKIEDHLGRVESIVENESGRGRNVEGLVLRASSQIRERRESLRRAFEERKEVLKAQEDALKNQINQAREAGNDALVRELQTQKDAVNAQREQLGIERQAQENILKAERLTGGLSSDLRAQERISKADFERQRLVEKAALRNFQISQAELAGFDAMLSQAKQMFSQSNFAEAERLARQADLGFEALRERIGGLDDLNDIFEIRGPGDELEIRGRENEAEIRGRENEAEIRGRENEVEIRGQETEIRGGGDETGDDRGGSGSGRR